MQQSTTSWCLLAFFFANFVHCSANESVVRQHLTLIAKVNLPTVGRSSGFALQYVNRQDDTKRNRLSVTFESETNIKTICICGNAPDQVTSHRINHNVRCLSIHIIHHRAVNELAVSAVDLHQFGHCKHMEGFAKVTLCRL